MMGTNGFGIVKSALKKVTDFARLGRTPKISAALSSAMGTSTALNSVVAEGAEKTAPVEYFRKDYKPLPYIVSDIKMDFDITDGKTVVTSELTIEKNGVAKACEADEMVLDGDETSVKLMSLRVGDKDLVADVDYALSAGTLTLKPQVLSDDQTVLKTVVEIVPEENTQLSGLYKSGSIYCSQCEAMGFRRITYFPDRPDNMAVFSNVRIEADAEKYPVLLSNGNLLEAGKCEGDGDRHYAVWSDPFPKPSYLFCVVAGDLASIRGEFTTASGRAVDLKIFSEKENVLKLDYAMDSLKRAMKWDEDKFGLEYDLDLYNVVAVNDFNMGGECRRHFVLCW